MACRPCFRRNFRRIFLLTLLLALLSNFLQRYLPTLSTHAFYSRFLLTLFVGYVPMAPLNIPNGPPQPTCTTPPPRVHLHHPRNLPPSTPPPSNQTRQNKPTSAQPQPPSYFDRNPNKPTQPRPTLTPTPGPACSTPAHILLYVAIYVLFARKYVQHLPLLWYLGLLTTRAFPIA